VIGSRWRAYRDLLTAALDRGYSVVGLDDWVASNGSAEEPCLILRHDVDQQPASALRMAAIETELGVRATWYFRWRTAQPRVIERIAANVPIGLHYETLTRAALAGGVRRPTPELVERCRDTLRSEVTAFGSRFGPIRSICPHGDTRAPGVHNHLLLRDQEPASFGVAFDGNEVMRGRPLGAWLTDRRGGSRWKGAGDPVELFDARVTPIFAVVHPNNWTSRIHAGADRTVAATLRRQSDEPPL